MVEGEGSLLRGGSRTRRDKEVGGVLKSGVRSRRFFETGDKRKEVFGADASKHYRRRLTSST